MPIYDDNPQNKVVTVEFIDSGNANFEFTRAYVYDECGEFKEFNDIDIDGNPYTVIGPIQKANSGTTVLDVTGIETTTTLIDNGNDTFTYTNEDGVATTIDLSVYIDDTNLARLVSGTLAPTGIATFTRDDSTTFTIDFSPLFDDTNLSRIVSGSITGTNLVLTRDDASVLSIDISGLATTTQLNNHINNTANPHQTTLLNLTDVSGTYTPNAEYILQANAAGTAVQLVRKFEAIASRDTPLLHQATTFFTYLTLTVVIPEAGDYLLHTSQRFSLNTTTSNFESHIEYNGDFYIINHIEFKDSAGPGQNVPNTTGGTSNTGTDNFQTRTGLKLFNLTPGTHVFNLEYRGQNANQEATIYEAEIYLKRIIV